MVPQPRPLIEVLAEIPDFRKNRGKHHALAAILTLACGAMRCGTRSYTAIAEWGRNYGARLMRALGFTRLPPCAAPLHTVLRRGAIRRAGYTNIAAACRRFAAQPALALALIGIELEN